MPLAAEAVAAEILFFSARLTSFSGLPSSLPYDATRVPGAAGRARPGLEGR